MESRSYEGWYETHVRSSYKMYLQLNQKSPLQFNVILQKIDTKITVYSIQVVLRILKFELILQEQCVN